MYPFIETTVTPGRALAGTSTAGAVIRNASTLWHSWRLSWP